MVVILYETEHHILPSDMMRIVRANFAERERYTRREEGIWGHGVREPAVVLV